VTGPSTLPEILRLAQNDNALVCLVCNVLTFFKHIDFMVAPQ
jgi:hypothetical protein